MCIRDISVLVNGFYGYTWDYNPSFEVDGGSGIDSLGEAYTKFPYSVTDPDKGTVYAVVGNSGSSVWGPALNHPMMQVGWGCDTCVGSLVIDVNGDRLDGHYMTDQGLVLDDFTIFQDYTVAAKEENAFLLDAMQVRPNPFWNRLEVEFDLERPAEVYLSLLSLEGKEVFQKQLGNLKPGNHQINLEDPAANMPAATYILRLVANDKVLSKRVIKYNP